MLEQTLIRKNLEIKSLMLQQRGTEDKPEEIMLRHPTEWIEVKIDNHATNPVQKTIIKMQRPRTHAELIGFKSETGFTGVKRPRPAEEPLDLEYIEDAFEDLDNYCQGIMCNYKTLKRFIIDGYNTYLDNNQKLFQQQNRNNYIISINKLY